MKTKGTSKEKKKEPRYSTESMNSKGKNGRR
jgi:hypothetical protein